MANKFTQSILERQYKEAQEEKRARKPKAEAAPPAEAPPQGIVPEPELLEAPPTAVPEPEPAKAADVKLTPITPREIPLSKPLSAPMNLDDYIIKDTERVAKNKTFYLDQAVIEGIKSAAKRQKVTDSKLVNDILKKVLGV